MTSSCATEGNTEGSCTKIISHTQRKELIHRDHKRIIVQLCWLRLAASRSQLKAFEELHPDSPLFLKSTITSDDWKLAVREKNIDMIKMAWSVAEVKTDHTVEEKLRLLPDMKFLIDWCIKWMKSDREAGRTQSYERIE
jgi:hypothetical protein